MATATEIAVSSRAPASRISARIAGFLLATIGPALFWVAALTIVSSMFSYAIPASTLIAVGGGITAFLSFIVAPIILRDSGTQN